MTISFLVHRFYAIIGIPIKSVLNSWSSPHPHSFSFFAVPFVNYMKTTLLKNHCLSISFLDLLLTLTKDDLRRIRQYDANIKIGWLHDEVKNSYFSVIWKTQEKVLYRGTTEALLISHVKSFRRFWKNQSIQNEKTSFFVQFALRKALFPSENC